MQERYAIYFAPDSDSVTWRLASSWLGRDALSDTPVAQPQIDGFASDDFVAATESARRYGFHATLKPPMTLADGCDGERLLEAAERFAAFQKPIPAVRMRLHWLSDFLAIVPIAQDSALMQFAANCVAHFEPFRRPMTEKERQKRLATGLTHRQSELLDQYGYPYVMDEFRMHLTLTDRILYDRQEVMMRAAETHFAPVLADPWPIESISVYREGEPGADFVRLADFRLGEKMRSAAQ